MAKFNLKTGNVGFCRKWKLSFEWSRKWGKKLPKNIEISIFSSRENSIKFKCLPNKRQFKKFSDFSMCVIFMVSHRILIFIQIYDFPYESKLFYDAFNFPSKEANL